MQLVRIEPSFSTFTTCCTHWWHTADTFCHRFVQSLTTSTNGPFLHCCLAVEKQFQFNFQSTPAAGRSGLAWALASLGVVPDKAWLSQFLAAGFADGLASDKLRCASTLFCIASLDFDYMVEWLGDFLECKHAGEALGQGGGLDLSLQKYAALVGVLGSLADMDAKQLRAAWLDQSLTPEW